MTIRAGLAIASVCAAALAPAQALSTRKFLAYFPQGGHELTREARVIIGEFADFYRGSGATCATVIGHADTSGSKQANMAVSAKRSAEVANTLALLGVPASKIAIRALGETAPAVATGDGVKEVMNRRVELRALFRESGDC